MNLILYLTIILITLPPVITYLLLNYLTFHRDKRSEHYEDINSGGINVPKPIRNLDPIETAVLQGYAFPSILRSKHVMLAIMMLYIILLLFILNPLNPNVYSSETPLTILNMIIYIVIFAGTFCAFLSNRKNYYFDLRSPVFATKGSLTSKGLQFYVRDIPIKRYHHAHSIPEGFEEGNEIYIEYSPYSKIIWSFSKTNKTV